MKFVDFNDGKDIELKPLSSKSSIVVAKRLQEFSKLFPRTGSGNEIDVAGHQAAEFLTDVARYILVNVYKIDATDFDDKVSMSEICSFLRQQIEKNGTSDFLTQPISALISGLEKFSASLAQAVDIAVTEATEAAKTT